MPLGYFHASSYLLLKVASGGEPVSFLGFMFSLSIASVVDVYDVLFWQLG